MPRGLFDWGVGGYLLTIVSRFSCESSADAVLVFRGPMPQDMKRRLTEAFDMADDLVRSLDETALHYRLEEPSNTIWDQFWCVVGARESYARAMQAGEWAGFGCSLTPDDRGSKLPLTEALASSRVAAESAATDAPTSRFALDLLLHETQHQGQIIRYLYGLGHEAPASWKQKWNL